MKKLLYFLVVLIILAITVFTSLFILLSNPSIPSFKADTLQTNIAFENYLLEEIASKNTDIRLRLTNFKKQDFQKMMDYIAEFVLNKTSSDAFSIQVKANYFVTHTIVNINLEYRMTKEEEEQVLSWIAQTMDPFLSSYPSDEDKMRFINETIVKQVEYDKSLQLKSAYDAVFNKSCVCEGYAILGAMMLSYANIENQTIIGTADGVDHIWNLAKLKGNWYHLDFTWNDPEFLGGEKDVNYVGYDYFLLSDREIESTHSWNRSLYPPASADL